MASSYYLIIFLYRTPCVFADNAAMEKKYWPLIVSIISQANPHYSGLKLVNAIPKGQKWLCNLFVLDL